MNVDESKERHEFEDFDDLDVPDEIYCSVCRKVFKSVLQWRNHEKSKKHKMKLSELGIQDTPEAPLSPSKERMTLEERESDSIEESGVITGLKGSSFDFDGSTDMSIPHPIYAPKASTSKKNGRRKMKTKDPKASGTFKCGACDESFISRNKLFIHIKEYGHATPK